MLCLALIFVRLFDFVMSFCSFLRFSFFIPFRRRCLCKAFIFSLHFFLFDFLLFHFFFCSFDTNRKWFMQNSSAQLIQNLPRPLKRPTYTRFDCRTHFFAQSFELISWLRARSLPWLPYWNFRSPDIEERHFVIYLCPFHIRNSLYVWHTYVAHDLYALLLVAKVGVRVWFSDLPPGQSLTNCKLRN